MECACDWLSQDLEDAPPGWEKKLDPKVLCSMCVEMMLARVPGTDLDMGNQDVISFDRIF